MSDALAVHDAAHKEQSSELHEVALKLLALCDQTHICVDGLDEKRESSEWDRLPGLLQVEDEAVAIIGDNAVTTDAGIVPVNIMGHNGKVVVDKSFHYKPRTPAYELWLVKKQQPEKITPDCAFTAGKHVPTGWPRKGGAYKFPVVCQMVPDDYQMLQVHKDGEVVRVFDKSGQEPAGLADLVDSFVALDYPKSAIIECIVSEDGVQVWDCLMLDGIDCTVLPYRERDRLLGQSLEQNEALPEALQGCEQKRIEHEDGLPTLEAGTWLVRYEDEVLTDCQRPFWFVLNAGVVTPGTVLPWVSPSESSDERTDGMIIVRDTGLPYLQIHKNSRGVSIFVADGGRNRASNLGQVVDMVEKLPEDVVLECQWTCTNGDLPVSAVTVRNPKQDLSECTVKLFPFDVLLYGDQATREWPMYERVDLLEEIILRWDCDDVELGVVQECERGSFWAFAADSPRSLTAEAEQCIAFRRE